MKVLFVALMLMILSATAFAGGGPVGQVNGNGDEGYSDKEYITLPVYHDTTGRTTADWSLLEWRLYRSTPITGGLQNEVGEMLLGRVIHPPACNYHQKYCGAPVEDCSKCGYYRPGDAKRYFAAYQAWTGPAKVRVPLVKGPKGDRGERGERGPRGPQGSPGEGVTNNYYSFNAVPFMSQQIGGFQPAIIAQAQLASVGLIPVSRIHIKNIATSSASASAPTTIDIDNSNANTNVNANNNAINVGDGSATGSATGDGDATAISGGD